MKNYLFVAAALLLTLTACEQKNKEQQQSQIEAITAGEKLFAQNCSTCHERKGRGDYLKNIPVTLLNRRSEAELMAWILGSDKHREMPNFDQLSDTERQQLATYLHSQISL